MSKSRLTKKQLTLTIVAMLTPEDIYGNLPWQVVNINRTVRRFRREVEFSLECLDAGKPDFSAIAEYRAALLDCLRDYRKYMSLKPTRIFAARTVEELHRQVCAGLNTDLEKFREVIRRASVDLIE